MIIMTRTVISFEMPKEYQAAREFEDEHPDWQKSESTVMVSYIAENTYHAETAASKE